MALAYTAPTWEDGSGTGISASQLQAICNCIEGLVQGTDKAVHAIGMTGSVITLTFADGTEETVQTSGLKGIVSIAKTGTSGYVDTYTITYTDGTTSTFTVTNGEEGSTPIITANASVTATTGTPSVEVVKTGTDAAPVFTFNFANLKGETGPQGPEGEQGPAGDVPITKYSQTLTAGSTSVTFSNVTTTANSIIEVATSVAGLEYNAITNSGSSYTVTFDAQASNVTIYLIVTEVV